MQRLAPVLAQVNQIPGVVAGYANETGTLVQVALKPGADAGRVRAEVRRILWSRIDDRVPVQLDARTAASQVAAQQWRDQRRVAELAAVVAAQDERRAAGSWAAVVLACLAVGCGLVGWWRRKRPAAQSAAAIPTLAPAAEHR